MGMTAEKTLANQILNDMTELAGAEAKKYQPTHSLSRLEEGSFDWPSPARILKMEAVSLDGAV
jgi:hypothetical protein